MRHYEILLLIHPDQGNQITAMIERYLSIVIKGGGQVHRQEDWGKLQLAYQINKLHKANYVLLNIECGINVIAELHNAFKFNDAIIRSLITKCDTAIKEQSVFLKNKDDEKNNKDTGSYNNYSNQSGYYAKDYDSKIGRGEHGSGSVDSSFTEVVDSQ